jgi:hypothetical protein
MAKCVFRMDLRQQPVSEHLSGTDLSEMFYRPAEPTVEECVHMLLSDDEICLGNSDRREILRGPRVVGYIRIVERCTCARPVTAGTE